MRLSSGSKRVALLLLLTSAIGSCRSGQACPATLPPPPVTVIAEPMQCNLPMLPPLPTAVGFPSAEGIFLTKTDWADLIGYVQSLRDYVVAASACVTGKAAL